MKEEFARRVEGFAPRVNSMFESCEHERPALFDQNESFRRMRICLSGT
jgi:hypothetical protein